MFGYDFNHSCTGLELQVKYTFYQDVIDTSSFVNFARFIGDFWNIQGCKYMIRKFNFKASVKFLSQLI